MRNRVIAAGLLILASAASASAQRVEVSGIFGWTLSDGVTGDGIPTLDGNFYNELDIKDSASWGFSVGVNATPNFEVGFLFGQQMSTLVADGTTKRDVGDMNVNSYHPYFAFNMGDIDTRFRPYFLIGLGATNYGSVSFTRASGAVDETDSQTRFSTMLGVGAKYFPAPKFGVRFGLHWAPTYIKTDAEGWWCDPYWGCYVTGDAQYSNQLQFNGGVVVRF